MQMIEWLAGLLVWVKSFVFGVANQVLVMPVYWAAPMMVFIGAADSSLLSLPEVNDIITVTRIAKNPNEVWFFPLFPAIGSVIGCLLLYEIMRGSSNKITKRFHPEAMKKVEQLFRRWGFFALAIPALLPPPLPFKIFVAAAGALGYPRTRFAATIMIARTVRYYFWGVAALIYREEVLQAIKWLETHFFVVIGVTILLVLSCFIVRGLFVIWRNRSPKAQTTYSD